MADLASTIRMLEQQRDELLEQANAIIRAIAALKGTDRAGRTVVGSRVDTPVTPARAPKAKKRHFTLSEEHKRKLVEGRKRAREARSAASDSPPPDAPRLVKKGAGIQGS